MPACPRCQTPAPAGTQCPACGAPVEPEPVLELDLDMAARAKPDGVERPTEAMIGGADGAAARVAIDDIGPRPVPVPRPPDPRTFAERERAVQMTTWRLTRVPVLLLLGWFTASHLLLGSTWVFIDNVNVLLHEAGHLLFSWDGRALHALGGTLGQLMWPALFAGYFLWKRRERFAAVACLWWFGENFIGIARYMDDAVVQELPLIGGDIHDWGFLFGRWELLSDANEIAAAFHWLGAGVMVGTLGFLSWWTVRPTPRELAGRLD